MVYFQKILEAALGLCLVVDGRILKVVDQIGSLLGLRRFSLNKSSVKGLLFKRWVVYSFLAALTAGIGVISCADTEVQAPRQWVDPGVTEKTPQKPGKVFGFDIEPLSTQVKATWDVPMSEDGVEEEGMEEEGVKITGYKLSVYKVEEFKEEHLKTEMTEPIEGTEGTTQEAIVGELENGQIYAFQIQATNAQGDGFPSEKIYSMPRPDGLGSLENLSSTAGDAVVTLSWDKIPLADQYSVLRSLGEDGDDYKELYRGDIMCSDGSQCSFTDNTSPINGELYFYKVVAQMIVDDPRLQKHEIVESSAVTPTSNTPRTVTNTQVTVKLVSVDNTRSITDGASVTLSIEQPKVVLAAEGITAYRVEALELTAADDSEPLTEPPPQDIMSIGQITQVSVGQPYAKDIKYRFKALSGSTGSYTEIPDTTAFLNVSKISPTKPVLSIFRVTEVSNLAIDLSWSSSDDKATHYTLKSGANDIFVKKRKEDIMSTGGVFTYTDGRGLGYSATYSFTLVPHIVLTGIQDVDGASISIFGVTPENPEEPRLPPADLEDLAEFVDVFVGTQYTHTDSYQPSRVYPVAAVPFGMVVVTPVTGFHTGASWEKPDDGGRAFTNSGNHKPTYLSNNYIKGFSAYSFQGPGCNISHDFMMMPSTIDADGANEWLSNQAASRTADWKSRTIPNDFQVHTRRQRRTSRSARRAAANNQNEEWAEPGYYRVTTKRNTVIEVTATKRTGLMRITYPATVEKGYFHLAAYTRVDGFDDPDSWARTRSGNTKALEGQVRAGQFCGEGGAFRYIMFMYGVFDRSYVEAAERKGTGKDGNEVRVGFDLSTGSKVVQYKFGISYVNMENAKTNLLGRRASPAREATDDSPAVPALEAARGENPDSKPDFTAIKQRARVLWNQALAKIKVRDNKDGTGTRYATRTTDKRRFYTFLFRSLLHPNIFSDVDGRYVGFDGSSTAGSNQRAYHTLREGQEAQYQYFSNWDIYRTQIPLLALIDKQVSRDIARSLLNNANQSGNGPPATTDKDYDPNKDYRGGFTRWGVANHDSGVMGGCPSSIMISTQYALGADLSKSEQDEIIQVFERSGKLDDVTLDGLV